MNNFEPILKAITYSVNDLNSKRKVNVYDAESVVCQAEACLNLMVSLGYDISGRVRYMHAVERSILVEFDSSYSRCCMHATLSIRRPPYAPGGVSRITVLYPCSSSGGMYTVHTFEIGEKAINGQYPVTFQRVCTSLLHRLQEDKC